MIDKVRIFDTETKQLIYLEFSKITRNPFAWQDEDRPIYEMILRSKGAPMPTDNIDEVTERFIVSWSLGIPDQAGRIIYEGDVLRTTDDNWGYGGEYDKTHDGYLYFIVPTIEELLLGGGWYPVESQCFGRFSIIGNQFEMSDEQKTKYFLQ